MPAPLDPKIAEKNARAKGWIPHIPFPGADKPWPGHCARCGKPGKPKYGNFCSPKSRQGPCRPCSGTQKKTEEEACSVMALRGLTPNPPFPGVNSPWESICGNCDGITSPTLSSVKKALKQGSRNAVIFAGVTARLDRSRPRTCCDWLAASRWCRFPAQESDGLRDALTNGVVRGFIPATTASSTLALVHASTAVATVLRSMTTRWFT